MNLYSVYIMANKRNTVIYIGVTSNLPKRVWEHKECVVSGFTKKYHCTKLVYYETTEDVWSAQEREKQLKGWRREKKEILINQLNPEWKDLDVGGAYWTS